MLWNITRQGGTWRDHAKVFPLEITPYNRSGIRGFIWEKGGIKDLEMRWRRISVDRQTDRSRAMRAEKGPRRTDRKGREYQPGACGNRDRGLEWWDCPLTHRPDLKHIIAAGDVRMARSLGGAWWGCL